MTCLPCIKEEENNFAMAAWQTSHSMAAKIPDLVASGRLDVADAELVLSRLIEADSSYVDMVRKAGSMLGQMTRPPWPEPAAEGV